jgi:hypothetical protein
MSYTRVSEDEPGLRAEVEQMLRRTEQTDQEEYRLHGVGQDEEELPGTCPGRSSG